MSGPNEKWIKAKSSSKIRNNHILFPPPLDHQPHLLLLVRAPGALLGHEGGRCQGAGHARVVGETHRQPTAPLGESGCWGIFFDR